MYRKPSKKKELVKLAAVYTLMTSLVLVTATLIVFFVLGFRFDANNGQVEQYAFMQFDSTPSGATVTVNGKVISSKTPTKTSVPAGRYEVTIRRDGYEAWSKTVNVKAGAITWLNYALLVPSKIIVEPVVKYESIFASLASPRARDIIIQPSLSMPNFSLVDLGSDNVKTSELVIPPSLYSEPTTLGVNHAFDMSKWDEGERYILVKHTYGDKYEWLIMDTQNIAASKNVTKLFNVEINDIKFSGANGNNLYILNSKDIRKLNLSAETISKSLVSNVIDFNIDNESSVITYVGTDAANPANRVVGIYREGDDSPYVIRTINGAMTNPLSIATTHYFNDDYIAISSGKNVDVLMGSYPNSKSDVSTSMKSFASFSVSQDVSKLSFSPAGEHIFVQSGPYFANYDMEYQTLSSSTIDGVGGAYLIKWIDDNHIRSDRDDKLIVRDFDNSNVHQINSVVSGQDVTLAHNGRYLYSIGKATIGYQLQRVRMILP